MHKSLVELKENATKATSTDEDRAILQQALEKTGPQGNRCFFLISETAQKDDVSINKTLENIRREFEHNLESAEKNFLHAMGEDIEEVRKKEISSISSLSVHDSQTNTPTEVIDSQTDSEVIDSVAEAEKILSECSISECSTLSTKSTLSTENILSTESMNLSSEKTVSDSTDSVNQSLSSDNSSIKDMKVKVAANLTESRTSNENTRTSENRWKSEGIAKKAGVEGIAKKAGSKRATTEASFLDLYGESIHSSLDLNKGNDASQNLNKSKKGSTSREPTFLDLYQRQEGRNQEGHNGSNGSRTATKSNIATSVASKHSIPSPPKPSPPKPSPPMPKKQKDPYGGYFDSSYASTSTTAVFASGVPFRVVKKHGDSLASNGCAGTTPTVSASASSAANSSANTRNTTTQNDSGTSSETTSQMPTGKAVRFMAL